MVLVMTHKKILIFCILSLCFVSNCHAYRLFGGKYERTTGRGYVVGRTDAMIGEIGDWGQILLPLSAFIYSAAIDDWEGNKQLACSVGATIATTEILKTTVREERPYEPEGSKGRTFPSGHTSFAFAGAAYWQRRYGWYVGVPMYLAASFVGYSRVRVKMHNWLDVMTAAGIGTGFNYLFTTRYNSQETTFFVKPADGGAYFMVRTSF